MITTREGFSELGFRLIILGFALSLIGFILVTVSAYQFPDTSTGIVILIGPIPILFGSGPHGSELIMVGLFMVAFTVLLFVFLKSRQIESEV